MKSYKSSCAKENFAHISRGNSGRYAVRWNVVESTEEEGGQTVVTVTYNETTTAKKPTFASVVELMVRDRYTASDELAFARQEITDVEAYKDYNAYVEQCKKWASECFNIPYTPQYNPTTAEVISQLRMLAKTSAEGLPDEQAAQIPSLFDAWKPGENVTKDTRRYDATDGNLYACVQPHMTQTGWEPSLTPALWRRVSVEEWPEWIQPTGAQDAYKLGDKVSHNENRWISLKNDNVWEPTDEAVTLWQKQA